MNDRLSFGAHITNICNRMSKNLYALAKISQSMRIHKPRITRKTCITSKFGYCPLAWMFHSRKLSSRVKNLHERILKILY